MASFLWVVLSLSARGLKREVSVAGPSAFSRTAWHMNVVLLKLFFVNVVRFGIRTEFICCWCLWCCVWGFWWTWNQCHSWWGYHCWCWFTDLESVQSVLSFLHGSTGSQLMEMLLAQWLRRCATNRKIAGSIPDGVRIFHWYNPSDHTLALGVDSASNRNEYQEYFLGVKKSGRCIGLTTWQSYRVIWEP